jgi:hypothetical protein
MAVKLKVVLVLLMACTLAGFVGAYCAALLLSRRSPKLIQAQRLELTDTQGNVRASFSAGASGSVVLTMLSKHGRPAIELEVDEGGAPKRKLTFYADDGRPITTLLVGANERGGLVFSSETTANQVSVGYSPVGDVDNDLGAWGLRIAGPNHTSSGVFAFTRNGKLIGFKAPLEPPHSAETR